ncbi:hypothetical protein BGW41_003905 [Actinomortierella wolfii]|nr:hypothetical protein BGW41_003905 [Actinomortierella wolfii]
MSGSIASPASYMSSSAGSTPRASPTNFKERFMVDSTRENRRARSSVSCTESPSSASPSYINSHYSTSGASPEASERYRGYNCNVPSSSHQSIPDESLMTPQESLQAGQQQGSIHLKQYHRHHSSNVTVHPYPHENGSVSPPNQPLPHNYQQQSPAACTPYAPPPNLPRHPNSASSVYPSRVAAKTSHHPQKQTYPLQFSTRAKAMAFLFEVLRFLQKDPCGCDLVRGCACGQDGIEDHQGKQPCYVCGEWFPERKDAQTGQNLGRMWHEQGSLRHHVAEARVKKWLDQVWRPPVTPATSPEQEAVGQFERQQQQQFYYQQAQYAQQQQQRRTQPVVHQQHYQQFKPESTTTAGSPYYPAPYYQPQQQFHQQQQQRAWDTHDVENQAHIMNRSRSSSCSSMYSTNSTSSPSSTTCSAVSAQHGFSIMAPSSVSSTSTFAASSRASSSASSPCSSAASSPLLAHASAHYVPEKSTIGRSTSFPIPQEILDPSYRSPTFTIKRSPSAATPPAPSSASAALSSNTSPLSSPTTPRTPKQLQQQQELSNVTRAMEQVSLNTEPSSEKTPFVRSSSSVTLSLPPSTSSSSTPSSPMLSSESSPIDDNNNSSHAGSSRFNMGGKFRLNFTSDRFREAVEASKVAKLVLRRL